MPPRSLTSSPASIGWLRPRWTVSRTRTLAGLAPTCCLVRFCCGNKTVLGWTGLFFRLFPLNPPLASLVLLSGPRGCARAARQSRHLPPLPADGASLRPLPQEGHPRVLAPAEFRLLRSAQMDSVSLHAFQTEAPFSFPLVQNPLCINTRVGWLCSVPGFLSPQFWFKLKSIHTRIRFSFKKYLFLCDFCVYVKLHRTKTNSSFV